MTTECTSIYKQPPSAALQQPSGRRKEDGEPQTRGPVPCSLLSCLPRR